MCGVWCLLLCGRCRCTVGMRDTRDIQTLTDFPSSPFFFSLLPFSPFSSSLSSFSLLFLPSCSFILFFFLSILFYFSPRSFPSLAQSRAQREQWYVVFTSKRHGKNEMVTNTRRSVSWTRRTCRQTMARRRKTPPFNTQVDMTTTTKQKPAQNKKQHANKPYTQATTGHTSAGFETAACASTSEGG